MLGCDELHTSDTQGRLAKTEEDSTRVHGKLETGTYYEKSEGPVAGVSVTIKTILTHRQTTMISITS